ncbi:PAS domain S-box protein [Phenylobacterium sp. LH3H17]|uniref:sensor histidine kinase n=1 Tax=Phenylobacterium sp. LH3H17 TaxID=2903901 RepID=UPI0020C9E7E4|nr:HWE histidine kinase domain-containing protein [Phenylobacterium sp. LH3H17]UTP38337.1 PAS domain S-box protein [Phenylobacterium sp. LH3H17]
MIDDESASRWSGSDIGSAALLKAMFDAADVIAGVFELLDDDYRYVTANSNAAAFYGKSEGGLDGLTGRDLGVTRAQIDARLTTLRACWAAQETQTSEYPFSLEGGRRGWFLGTFSPMPGERPRVAFVVLDVTARHQAQRDADRQKARLTLALDATGLGLWEYDLATDQVDWDARMRTLFGVGPEAAIDFATYAAAVHPDDFPLVESAYGDALAGKDSGAYVVEHRTTAAGARGSAAWVRGAAQVVFAGDGRPRRVIGTAQDITAQVVARERQDLLLAELNHRVKNNLATVQAIAAHAFRSAGHDPGAFRRAFEERLQSLARGHDLLTRNVWETAELTEIFAAALAPFDQACVRLHGEAGFVRLKPDLAVSLVMVLHELATNAAKYGALSAPGGDVAIDWSMEPQGLRIVWRESGGPPVSPPQREGFGSRLIRAALGSFGGSAMLAFPPEGLICEMTAPLDGQVAGSARP